MSSQDAHLALCTAYGARGVPKLVEALRSADADDPSPTRTALTTLHSLLSTQENKCAVVASEDAVALLTAQLAAPDEGCRRLAALVIGALALMLQGRIAVREAASVGVLAGLLADGADAVREAASSALLALSQSRDGCSTLMEHDGIVDALVGALGDDAAGAAALGCLSTLANLSRLDLGVSAALDAGLMAILCAVVGAKASSPQLYPALQTLWNLANSADGKVAAIDCHALSHLAWHVARGGGDARRLAAGCVMAITVDKQGKFEALDCVAPLCALALSPAVADDTDPDAPPPDASAVRDAVGALKNLAEWPKARKQIAKIFRREGADKLLVEGPNGDAVPLFDRPITDGGVWPESERFVHQNVAPGGAATKAEAAVRARWGYPAPLAAE